MKIGLYFTLGDLGLQNSLAILEGVLQGGVDLLEIGLPFSDPLLDGISVQQSHVRAVAQNISWSAICDGIQKLKSLCEGSQQISLMTSIQLLYDENRRFQLPKVDGILVTDIKHNIQCPFPLSSERVWFLSQELVLSHSFCAPPENISMVYLTRVQGTTGENQQEEFTTADAIKKLRNFTEKKIWLGFGISSKKDIEKAQEQGADGVVIGSAFINKVTDYFLKNLRYKSSQEQQNLLNDFGRNFIKYNFM